jgi:hypothetical protein
MLATFAPDNMPPYEARLPQHEEVEHGHLLLLVAVLAFVKVPRRGSSW